MLSGSLKTDCTPAGYEKMDWDKGATRESRTHRAESNERDGMNYNRAKTHQKGPWDFCGWEFHSQIIKLWRRNVLEAT